MAIRKLFFGPTFLFTFTFFLLGLHAGPARAAELTLMAVGDVLPHPSWQAVEIPVDRLFKDAVARFFEADVVVGNLETPLTDRAEPTTAKAVSAIKAKKEFVFKAETPETAQGLRDAGFTVLTLANNHMLDYREEGLLDTLDRLKEAGICMTGAGRDLADACKPGVVSLKGMELVFISASDVVPKGYEALPDKPGIASMKDGDAFIGRVKAARAANPEAIIVLSVHWGVEATFAPTSRQKELARRAVDAGADLILGHHPHRLQGVEIYGGRPIFYSLGNFQFDSKKPGDESVIARISFKEGSREPARVSVSPVMIGAGGYPRVLDPAEPDYASIIEKLDKFSRPLGSTVRGEDVLVVATEENLEI